MLLLLLLLAFLTAIKLMGASFKLVGKTAGTEMFHGISHPLAGLCVGILATVIVQSSSVTTSTIVALVGSGQIPVGAAVPMVMGANIGTSITNTLVSIGHITRSEEFRRAFAGATVHDFFNLITVLVLLPLELATGFLSRTATWMTGFFELGGDKLDSPIKPLLDFVGKQIEHLVTKGLGLQGWSAALVLLAIALLLIIVSLTGMTRQMRRMMAERMERALNKVLQRSGAIAILVGVVLTMAVQSSSITTSLLVPMMGAGILTLEAAFPVTLGANIGTTITALLASLASDKPAGLTIALTHVLFNVAGVVMIYPIPAVRNIPIWLARTLASLTIRSRVWAVVYIVGVFVVMPLLGILIWR